MINYFTPPYIWVGKICYITVDFNGNDIDILVEITKINLEKHQVEVSTPESDKSILIDTIST